MRRIQGKIAQQYKDSATFVFIGYVGIFLVVSVMILGMFTPTKDNKEVSGEYDRVDVQSDR
jgi:hypothetical protein